MAKFNYNLAPAVKLYRKGTLRLDELVDVMLFKFIGYEMAANCQLFAELTTEELSIVFAYLDEYYRENDFMPIPRACSAHTNEEVLVFEKAKAVKLRPRHVDYFNCLNEALMERNDGYGKGPLCG